MKGQRFLVTGGGGFVGRAICKALVDADAKVVSVSRGHYPELEKLGVETVRSDLAAPSQELIEVFKRIDGVFHVAAKVDMWGEYKDFYESNVVGTQNIVDLCLKSGVERLVFTSSPSVVAREYDLCGVDESLDYPADYLANYPRTKAMAEKLVLAVDQDSLRTVSLRPHLIWGPGDNNFVPTILEKARAGKLFRVGSGRNLVDFSYIEDCVAAHLAAMKVLASSSEAQGKAFFISQGEPYPLWKWIDRVLEANNLPPVKKSLPYSVAKLVALVCETFAKISPVSVEPRVTRFLVDQMSHAHFFDISSAKKLLEYKPSYTMEQAFAATFG